MAQVIPLLQKYMTPSPHSIGREQTLASAFNKMMEHNIRHLPVLHGGKVEGLISDRDIQLLESLKDVDPRKMLVSDAMSMGPYTAHPNTPLDEVCTEMAKHKYGSAVVVEDGKVVGIFTAVDALRTLAELLQTRLAK